MSHSATPSFFLPYQERWINDPSPLKIIEKSRQIGITYADACDSVRKAAHRTHANDVWVSSRDEGTARLYLDHCKRWARALNYAARDMGEQFINREKDLTAHVLRFSTGYSIYSISSCPNALVGKTGHLKLDEFAIHKDQRELFRVAKPCTTWGGQLSIISTHRGCNSVFNEILRSVKEQANPMGWSHHRVTLHDAVSQGLVEQIGLVTGKRQSRGAFIERLRAECLDEEQWQQEYCCQPSDENSAFITWEMITAAEFPNCMRPFSYLESSSSSSSNPDPHSTHATHLTHSTPVTYATHLTHLTHVTDVIHATHPLYVGVDVARKKHLCVIDVGEKIGDVMWDRCRIELQNKTFSEIQHELYRVLSLPKVQRCCIDATGLGMQLAEEAREKFGWKVEPVTFTGPVKEELAFELRHCFEDRLLRIDPNPALRSDLRGIKKETTIAGNIRFVSDDVGHGAPTGPSGHCDRFWAKALRQHAAKQRREFFAIVIE